MKITDRTTGNKLYQKIRNRHYTIMSRCYNSNNYGYKHYGGRGVYVCERWHELDNFIEDIDKIDGWDLDLFMKGKLAIDKDYKVKGNKEYALEKCTFVTTTENNQLKPNQQRPIIIKTPEGKIVEETNQSEASRKYNLGLTGIHKCLKGKFKHTKYHQISYKDEYFEGKFVDVETLYRPIIIGKSPKGVEYEFTNASKFARENNLIEATVIYACANGKVSHTAFWQFRYKKDVDSKPFLPVGSLRDGGNKKPIKAISPKGKEIKVTNRTEFAKNNSMQKKKIREVLDGKIDSYKGWRFYFI